MGRLGRRCTGIGVRWWRLLLRPCRPRSLIPCQERTEGASLSLSVRSFFSSLRAAATSVSLIQSDRVPVPLRRDA